MTSGATKLGVFLKNWNGQTAANVFLQTAYLLLLSACAKEFLVYENSQELTRINEYEKKLEVKEIDPPSVEPPKGPEVRPSSENAKEASESKAGAKDQRTKNSSATAKAHVDKKAVKAEQEKKVTKKDNSKKEQPRLPEIESSEGFVGRRPIEDPFRVGEKVVLKLSYFNVVAGDLAIEVLPFVEVNGNKSYRFRISVKSNDLFSLVYAVDDYAETYLDYEQMRPYNFMISVKESKQLREVRSLFDWKKQTSHFWEKRITKEDGVKTEEMEWKVPDFSQNVISAVFYMRAFQMKPGNKVQFHLADKGKNMLAKAVLVRKEVLKTDLGNLRTLVMKPEVEIEGVFQPVGDILFWLTDDDRKLLVRIESAIRIGTILGKVSEIKLGEGGGELPLVPDEKKFSF